jgi:hypothetical protein
MANSYTNIAIAVGLSVNGAEPWVTISAQVNGTAVVTGAWYSVYQAHAGSVITFENFVQPLLLQAYNNIVPPTATAPPTTSFSF